MAGSLSKLDKVELTLIEIELSRINGRDAGSAEKAPQDLNTTLGELARCGERIDFLCKRAKGAWDAARDGSEGA